MKTLTRNETADFLLNNDHFSILTHRRPDGDTIGSSAALCRILRKMGKTAHIIRNSEVSDRFAWLHEGLTKEVVADGDTIVTVDVASPGMLPKAFEKYLGQIALRIDRQQPSGQPGQHGQYPRAWCGPREQSSPRAGRWRSGGHT